MAVARAAGLVEAPMVFFSALQVGCFGGSLAVVLVPLLQIDPRAAWASLILLVAALVGYLLERSYRGLWPESVRLWHLLEALLWSGLAFGWSGLGRPHLDGRTLAFAALVLLIGRLWGATLADRLANLLDADAQASLRAWAALQQTLWRAFWTYGLLAVGLGLLAEARSAHLGALGMLWLAGNMGCGVLAAVLASVARRRAALPELTAGQLSLSLKQSLGLLVPVLVLAALPPPGLGVRLGPAVVGLLAAIFRWLNRGKVYIRDTLRHAGKHPKPLPPNYQPATGSLPHAAAAHFLLRPWLEGLALLLVLYVLWRLWRERPWRGMSWMEAFRALWAALRQARVRDLRATPLGDWLRRPGTTAPSPRGRDGRPRRAAFFARDPRARVRAAFASVEGRLPGKPARTARRWAAEGSARWPEQAGHFAALALLYEAARYGPLEPSPEQVRAARAHARQLLSLLKRVVR